MHLEVQSDFIEDLGKNNFLKKKAEEFKEAVKVGNEKEFLDDNPDFFQMMMHLSSSDKIKVVYDDKGK